MPEKTLTLPTIDEEFAGAQLGDERRGQRLLQMARALADQPAASFPVVMGNDAALEGTYRLLNNDAVSPQDIFAVHQRMTKQRVADHSEILVVHDTTSFKFSGDSREGLGPLLHKGGTQGFFAHLALAVSRSRVPQGVLGYEHFCRSRQGKGKRSHKARLRDGDSEGHRWWRLVEKCEAELAQGPRAVHVMDREADSYPLLSRMKEHGLGFVVRLCSDRSVAPEGEGEEPMLLSERFEGLEHAVTREVQLSRRGVKPPTTRKIHPPRVARAATLALCATTVELRRPSYLRELPETLAVNVVRVHEPNPPAGDEPIEWVLLTSEPIDGTEDIERIVDAYRIRWVIEEYFKSLKTGCAFEKRQLESLDALLRALALFIPIAWRLLALRSLAHAQPDAPAEQVLTAGQLAILRSRPKNPLPAGATVGQALLAIAALGGHIKNNGAPGWQVLGRGFEKLLWMETGWAAAQAGAAAAEI